MDIIINPTNKCNFNCSFCMASDLEDKTLTIEKTIELLDKYYTEPGTIIINGGDPLMMDPQYYKDLLSYLNKKFDTPSHLSLTTNLYDWYIHPEKWYDILNNKNVGVITSFQYGESRRLKTGRIYKVDLFRKVMSKFNETFHYTPDFISVVDENNQPCAYKTAKLAKDLGVKCKLNKIMTLGRAKYNKYFPWYRMFNIYINAIDKGLGKYISNISNLKSYFSSDGSYCPVCRKCYHGIRAINNDGKVYPCGNLTSDEVFNKYDLETGVSSDQFAKDYNMISFRCLFCENYKLCNSCRSIICEVKRFRDEENYCKQMKKIIPILKEKLA